MASARRGEVRIHVDAAPEQVWPLLANLERMGEWSPECYRVRWLDGASSPAAPGARFQGWNKVGRMRWSVTCEVKTADPGRELAFSTVHKGREMVRWRYRLEPTNGGTDLIESFEVLWLSLAGRFAEDLVMRDRDRRREDAMRATLERIRATAEADTAAGESSRS
jgi:uncharacterized protein YndB with AHSA1/START domain